MAHQMEHQLKTWGNFSEQLEDYTSRGIQLLMETPAGKELTAIVDPFAYREALTLPKLIINGTNDRYWPLDALNLYWQDLAGQKYALYVPNHGHGIRDEARLMGGIAALHQQVSGGESMPQPTWEFENHGEGLTLTITTDKPARNCQVWLAESATRDFRDARWKSNELQPQSDTYHYQLEIPETGYAAVFGEMIYPGQHYPLHLSTNVQILSGVEEQSK